MIALTSEDYYRALFHTGMSGIHGIPSQDLLALQNASTKIPSTKIRELIIDQLDRCDLAYENTDMTKEPSNYKSLTTGDVNRTEVRFDLKEAHRRWWEFYLAQTDKLCNMLWVPNYWREDQSRYRFERLGAEFVSIPDRLLLAEQTTGDALYTLDLISGGTGF